MTPDELGEYIRREVDKSPPLTEAQKAKLSVIFQSARRAKKAA